MERLIEVATQEGMQIVEHAPLPESYLGLYYQAEGYHPAAFLSETIYGQRKWERVVLAEELGHHLTTTTHSLPKYFKSFSQKVSISKTEYKASRKGSQILISANELLDAITSGLEEVWELAEHFNVPDDYMYFRLKVWEVSGK